MLKGLFVQVLQFRQHFFLVCPLQEATIILRVIR